MKEAFHLDQSKFSSVEKEHVSDQCLEKIIVNIDNFKDFYQSKYVLDTENEESGFAFEKRQKMIAVADELKVKIIDIYETHNINILRESQLNHIMGNSILMLARNRSTRYEREGREVSAKFKNRIKNEMELLNNYVEEISDSPEILEQELTHEDGHLQEFTRFFKGKIDPGSLNRILILQLFRDLEKGEIRKEDFSRRLEIIDEKTRIKNFLDLKKLEHEGLIVEKRGDREVYKFIA